MPTAGTLRVGQVAPQTYWVTVSQDAVLPAFDFTTVSAASIVVKKPSGATQTWTTALSAQTTTGLTATHTLVLGDLDEAGSYTGYLLMTVPGGTIRSDANTFYVAEEFADVESNEVPGWFIGGAIISGGGGGSTPSGTGLRKVVAGVESGTATTLVNADVNASAAIAVSKLAAGTDTYVLTTTAGIPVWAAPSGGGSVPSSSGFYTVTAGIMDAVARSAASGIYTWLATPSSANLAAAITDETGTGALMFATAPTFTTSWKMDSGGAGVYTFLPSSLATNVNITWPAVGSNDTVALLNATQTFTGKTYSAATNPATVGVVRFASADAIYARNASNSADAYLIGYASSDTVFIGLSPAYTTQAYGTIIGASAYFWVAVGSSYYIRCESSEVRAGYPIVGDSTAYSVHGQVTSAHTDANYTVPTGEYKFETIKFNTLCTAGRTITFPAPASDAAAYYKEIINGSSQTLTITTGAGATKTLATGLGQWFRFTSSEGVKASGGTYTP